MTTVDVTAEEIEDAPLLINPQVKEVKPDTRSRLNFVLCIVLAFDTILQIIAIVTPGWNVVRGAISASYESVYYTIGCADTTPFENVSTTACTTVTFLNDFAERYNAANDALKPALVSVYNLRVRYQINIQFGWLIVVGTTIFQVVKYIKSNEAYPKLTAINAMVLICACSAMYQALYEAFVKIDAISRESEHSSVDVGFPYSVFLYFITYMQTCACTVVVLKQIYDYIRHIELALMETKVQVETLQKQYDAEAEEFKHYRQLHTDKNRLRGRSRKSRVAERRSQKGNNRVTSQRHSVKPKEYNDNSSDHLENRNDHRHGKLHELPYAHSSRKHETKDHQTHQNCRLAHSGTSRESSPTSNNHRDRHCIDSVKASSQLDQPSNLSLIGDYSTVLHDKLPEISEATSDKNCSNLSKVLPMGRQNADDLESTQSKSKTEQVSHIGNVSETVSAEVHIPSIDGIEIKD